jgi:hypothetical protein
MSYPRKTIKELFDAAKAEYEERLKTDKNAYFNERYWLPGDYTTLFTLGGENIVTSVDVGDYQGDSLVLLEHPTDGRLALVEYGWGSCSGCDTLQSCEGDLVELQALADSLTPGEDEWKTPTEMVEYFRDRNWSDRYYYRDSAVQSWVKTVIAALTEKVLAETT